MRSEQRRHRAYRLYAHAPSIESSSTAETDARLDAQALGPALRDALTALSPDQREVLLLRAWAGLGRPGVAVGLFFKNQPGRIELILDPHSGVFLSEREISLNAMAMHAPVGSVTGWTAIDRQGVVNSDHQPERHRS